MEQKKGRAVTHLLHVPAKSSGLNETACGPVRPVLSIAIPQQIF
jgi:hypothetical protein